MMAYRLLISVYQGDGIIKYHWIKEGSMAREGKKGMGIGTRLTGAFLLVSLFAGLAGGAGILFSRQLEKHGKNCSIRLAPLGMLPWRSS